jgi:Concanavalin A-like lectin/glucanases superfamily
MGIAYNTSIVKAGLVLHLDAANVKSYPGTGSVWKDLSGKSNHATLFNAPTFLNGIVSWNGTNQYAQVTANQDSLDFSVEQTVIIWMKHSFTTGRRNPWDQAYGGYGTWTHEAGSSINYYYGSSGVNNVPYTSRGSATTPRDLWNMTAITRNASFVNWYLNGVLSNSGANVYPSQPTTAANIRIAAGYAGYWQGDMGQVIAYTRALTAAEIKQNFEAIRRRYGI